MIIVDTELSGLEVDKHSIVSIGAIDFENPERQFYKECRIFEGAHIMDEALSVNGFTRDQITDPTKPSDGEIVKEFLEWVSQSKEQTLAGQNVSFDHDFLKAAAQCYHLNWLIAKRTLDLHSICYFHMSKHSIEIPHTHEHSALNLDAVVSYCGFKIQRSKHNALEDAKIEAECFHRLFFDKPFFQDFKDDPVPW